MAIHDGDLLTLDITWLPSILDIPVPNEFSPRSCVKCTWSASRGLHINNQPVCTIELEASGFGKKSFIVEFCDGVECVGADLT